MAQMRELAQNDRMKRFDFPLERVRRWRSEQASLEELKLQQLIASRATGSGAVASGKIEDERAADRKCCRRLHSKRPNFISLDAYRLHVRQAASPIWTIAQRQCEAQIAKQRQRVIEARRQFELLDRLRNKALAEWRAGSNKEQEDLAAELFLAKSVRDTLARRRAGELRSSMSWFSMLAKLSRRSFCDLGVGFVPARCLHRLANLRAAS